MAECLLFVSATLGLASMLTCFAATKALEGVNGIFGGGMEVKSGMLLAVLLCFAATLHILIVGYVGHGWLNRPKAGLEAGA